MSTPSLDHTAIELLTDPEQRRFAGEAYHGNTPFDVPFVSRVTDDLWQGGCESGLVLPDEVQHVVSLYPWERYIVRKPIKSELYIRMHDEAVRPDGELLLRLATWVNECRKTGVTLVHCQAGLNRSSLVVAFALMLEGRTAKEAVDLVREARSPACLCNPAFERWLLEYEVGAA